MDCILAENGIRKKRSITHFAQKVHCRQLRVTDMSHDYFNKRNLKWGVVLDGKNIRGGGSIYFSKQYVCKKLLPKNVILLWF